MNYDVANLKGSWISDPEYLPINNEEEIIKLDFKENGVLIYTIIGKHADQKMFLTYRVENNTLFTNQPSHPKEKNDIYNYAR